MQRRLETLIITLKTDQPEAYSKKRVRALIEYAENEGFTVHVDKVVGAPTNNGGKN